MSKSGKHVLGAVTLCAAGVIYAVHYQQTWEKAEMHKGVLRDKERIAKNKAQKMRDDNRIDVLRELEDDKRRIIGSASRRGMER
jgi:hypothetical protein